MKEMALQSQYTTGTARRRWTGSLAVLLAPALGWVGTAPARAIVTYTSDVTINTPINDNVDVRGTAHVTVVAGGSISGFLRGNDNSTINMSGGSIGSILVVFHNGTANVSGGSIGIGLRTLDSSMVNISGGSIGRSIVA